MEFKVKHILWIVIGMFAFAFYQIFSHDISSTSENPLNKYTVYQTSATNRLVNYNLKQEVKENSQSTEGLEPSNNDGTITGTNGDNLQTNGTERTKQLWELLKKYAKRYDTDAVFLAVICSQESDFGNYPGTYNRDGYVGVMQIKESGDGPKKELKEKGLWESDMTEDVMDDENNINIAAKYLKYGYDRFIKGTKHENDIGAWAAGFNSWWVTTLKYNPPYIHGNTENKNYYYQTKQRYKDYLSGAKKIGDK